MYALNRSRKLNNRFMDRSFIIRCWHPRSVFPEPPCNRMPYSILGRVKRNRMAYGLAATGLPEKVRI